MALSKYQEAIIQWAVQGEGDGIINAVAGSGKSFTLLECTKVIRGTIGMLAFNKHIADELQAKVGPGTEVKTCHSLGMGAISRNIKPNRTNVQAHKYSDIAQSIFQDKKEANDFARLLDLARATLTDPNDTAAIWAMIDRYGMEDITSAMIANLPAALTTGRMMAKRGTIDFTDMIWIPHVENYKPYQFQFVLVDEAQDLNAAQLSLVLKARARGGRMLFVGDPFQSIYGFAGADCESFQKIQVATQAFEMPLSICYRCPSKVLDLARQIVPQIEDRPNAPEGIVDTVKESELVDKVQKGDLVLCRLTAPLIKACIQMIRHKRAARVRGRDLAKNLTNIVRKAAKANRGQFDADALYAWSEGEIAKITKRKHYESALESHNDKVEGIIACWQAFGNDSVNDFCAEIEELFSDGRASVILSTVHRAKGLEEKRVFILKPEKLPMSWKNQRDWEFQQEMNLRYVALTRATEALYFVESAPKGGSDE